MKHTAEFYQYVHNGYFNKITTEFERNREKAKDFSNNAFVPLKETPYWGKGR